VINSVLGVREINDLFSQTNVWSDPTSQLRYSPAHWFNISDEYYRSEIQKITDPNLKQTIEIQYDNVTKFVGIFQLFQDHQHCRYTKSEMRGEQFLFCTYMKSNLDMITMSQVVGAILLIMCTLTAIPAIRKFEWAGRANLHGVLNGGKLLKNAQPRPKRYT
jgi:hypothetical protein